MPFHKKSLSFFYLALGHLSERSAIQSFFSMSLKIMRYIFKLFLNQQVMVIDSLSEKKLAYNQNVI